MKTIRLIGMALLAIVISVSFIACSSDDNDETEKDNFVSIITNGAWSQDGDNDIISISKDGTGFMFENAAFYNSNTKTGYSFSWVYSNNTITIKTTGYYENGNKTESYYDTDKWIVTSYSNSKIVLTNAEDESDIWTWKRHN